MIAHCMPPTQGQNNVLRLSNSAIREAQCEYGVLDIGHKPEDPQETIASLKCELQKARKGSRRLAPNIVYGRPQLVART